MPESTMAIVGVAERYCSVSDQNGRTASAVGQTWFDDGVVSSLIRASLVIVSPGLRARTSTRRAFIVADTEPTSLSRRFVPSPLPYGSPFPAAWTAFSAPEVPSLLWMITLTSAFGVSCALASSSGSRYVDGSGFRLACASGIVVTNKTVRIASSPRPPLPQRALARESPPRFPVPQRALERVPQLCLDIPLPFRAVARSRSGQLEACF